jgi:hypothetical protein
MHTFNYHDESLGPCDGITINYNGDYSGDAEVIRDEVISKKVKIPCKALLQFAAEYVRMQKINELEIADWEELL